MGDAMRVAKHIEDIPSNLSFPVVTLGNFDGVHLGHRQLVNKLLSAASQRHGTSVVITFRPHPVKILSPSRAPSLISTYDEKLELLGRLGVDWVLELPFNRDFSEWSAERFIDDLLVNGLGVSHFLAGPDCHFGKGRVGDAELLSARGAVAGFTVENVAPVIALDDVVSSSRIRKLVSDDGDVSAASQLLGRPFRLQGTVVKGAQRGRTIGFPTANLQLVSELIPLKGVYAAWAGTQGNRYRAVVNVGNKPTFGGTALTVEAHLMDFEGDIYGERLDLDLAERIRSEQRFDDVDALVSQIGADVALGRELLS